MRTKTVLRYFCDHCAKGGFKKPNMEQHELTCTRNPARLCWLCEDAGAGRDYQSLIKEFVARKDVIAIDEEQIGKDGYNTDSAEAIGWLSAKCGGCPACVLSVLRQGEVFAFNVFDYRECVAIWHAERSREMRDMLQ